MASSAAETRFETQRHRILKAAAMCFNQKGYSGTSLKDVSQQLNLTDAALYYYVKNKEELVYQCYLRAAELARNALLSAVNAETNGLLQAECYVRNHIEIIVGDAGPIAIMSEIPSLRRSHRNRILELSREHSAGFEAILQRGIHDGSIAPCDVRMTGNAIMGSINWIPKWYHGKASMAKEIRSEFPRILMRGLRPD